MAKYYNIHSHLEADYISETDSVVIHNLSQEEIEGEINYQSANTYYSCGIHPWNVASSVYNVDDLEQLIANSSRIVAIGECGLDKLIDVPLENQLTFFEQQIKLAEKLELPLIIHCVKAWEELIRVYKKYKPQSPWILHGFRGNKQQVEQLMKFGFYFSIGQNFNSDALKAIYTNRLFLETDDACINIQSVYKNVSEVLSFKSDFLLEKIDQNVSLVFNL